jgi:hypothetical protein
MSDDETARTVGMIRCDEYGDRVDRQLQVALAISKPSLALPKRLLETDGCLIRSHAQNQPLWIDRLIVRGQDLPRQDCFHDAVGDDLRMIDEVDVLIGEFREAHRRPG